MKRAEEKTKKKRGEGKTFSLAEQAFGAVALALQPWQDQDTRYTQRRENDV